jgi:hypothetical protein
MGQMASLDKIKLLDEKLKSHLLEPSISNRVSSTKLKYLSSFLIENKKQYVKFEEINKGRNQSLCFSNSDLIVFNNILQEIDFQHVACAVMPGVIYFVDKGDHKIAEKPLNQTLSLLTS